jgi:AraC family transcriptional regulator
MLQYIDAHIKERMNVENLAERAGFSPYYFCRMFQYGVGSSIMEYVRNRRLTYAACELGSGRRIVDIAVDYGFETHSGFSKAFRRYFGCPPEIYRAVASFNIPKLPVLKEIDQFTPGCMIEPKIIARRAAFKLAGYSFKTNPTDWKNAKPIPKFWKECRTDGRLEKLHSEPFVKYHAELGVCFPEYCKDGDFLYVIGVEVKERHNIPADYDVYTIPEAVFAVFTTLPSGEENLPTAAYDTWQYIFSEWLPNSGYEVDNNGFAFELYDERSMGNTEKVLDIYLPIVKRQF